MPEDARGKCGLPAPALLPASGGPRRGTWARQCAPPHVALLTTDEDVASFVVRPIGRSQLLKKRFKKLFSQSEKMLC